MRSKVETLQNELWVTRSVCKANKTENNVFKGQIQQLQKCNDLLREKVQALKERNAELVSASKKKLSNAHKLSMKPIIVKKKFNNLKDLGTKTCRKKKYRAILDSAIKSITECTSAKITLYFDNLHTDFTWTEQDLHLNRVNLGISREKCKSHSQLSNAQEGKDKTACRKLSYMKETSSMLTDSSKYSDHHVRKVICAMDENRISQRAYQNMKNACSGHMPGLNQIKEQKNFMSMQLPIIEGEQVTFQKSNNKIFTLVSELHR